MLIFYHIFFQFWPHEPLRNILHNASHTLTLLLSNNINPIYWTNTTWISQMLLFQCRTEWIGRKYPRVNSSKYKRTVHFFPTNQDLSIFNQEKFNPLDSIISLVIKNSNDSSAKNLSKKKCHNCVMSKLTQLWGNLNLTLSKE